MVFLMLRTARVRVEVANPGERLKAGMFVNLGFQAGSATGLGVADATVQVLKNGTALTDTVSANIVATTKSDASGNYRFSFLLPGTYVVRATPPAASGFKPALLTGGVVVTSGAAITGKVIVVIP